MKIIHLADIHLGKIIQEQSLLEDQEYMLNKIIEVIKEQNIEAVLISGDVYDRGVPPAEAVNLLDTFLNTLIKELKKKVFIIAGNHDSKDRLGFGNKIFENDGLYIESKYEGAIKKVQLEDEHGKLNIYMLPFIKPIEVKKYVLEEEQDEPLSYDEAIHKIIEKENIDESQRNIILTHQFVTAIGTDVERTESEVLSIGGLDNVDVSNFSKFDYVAIGHVHRPQKVGRDTARYAGTMLKYSFSEVNHKKTMPILDFKEKGNIDIKLEELKPLRDMREIKGPIEELIKNNENTEDYIRAIITNNEPVYDAIGQIRKIYPNVLKLEIQNAKTALNMEKQESNLQNVRNKSEIELFNDFYKFQNNVELNDEQIEFMEGLIKQIKEEG